MTRLKSLELQGYKTFASNAIFEFPGMITAIVGPNGSGKSNIADAIRWVLGEQAYSVLRGKKTEDMIFAGSELRPRAGMALASITFNNEDGWLPIDFNEVVISRRAYRDGENEYLLNNQRVRLKEINELLSQTGLAERTYTIIGQGLVDAALSLKPDERRKFFEEAAGIGLYRTRREEAINRLEATKRNLERVQDIINELGPRVHSLERQTKKIQEYERIRSDLRLMLRDWYGFQWNKHNDELLQSGVILKEREKNLEKARNAAQKVEEDYKGFYTQMQGLRNKIIDLNQQLSTMHQEREIKTRESAVLKERILGLQAKTHDTEVQIATISEEIKSNKISIDSLKEEINLTSKEIHDVTQEKSISELDLNTRVKERNLIEEKIKNLDAQRIELNTKKVENEIRLEHLHQSLKESNETINDYKKQVEGFSKNNSKNKENVDQLEEKIVNLQSEKEKLTNTLREYEQTLSSHELTRSELKQQLTNLKVTSDTLKDRKEFFETAYAQMIGSAEGAKFLIKKSRSDNLDEICGLLYQFLKVPRGLEKAVTSVLGEIVDTVIISGKMQLSEIKNYLSESSAQKTFIYKRNDQQSDIKKGQEIVEGISHLIDQLSFPEDFRPLISELLNNYFICDDELNVSELLDKLPTGSACVTREGDVYYKNGLVIISGKGLQSSYIYTREIEEAQVNFNNSELKIKELKNQEIYEVDFINQMIEKINGVKDKLKNFENELTILYESLVALSSQTLQIKEKINWCNEQISLLEGKDLKQQLEIEEISKFLEQIRIEEKQLQGEITNSRQQLDQLPIVEITAILNEKQQTFEKVNQRSQILATQLNERQKQLILLEQRKVNLGIQLNAGIHEIQQLEVEINNESNLESRIKDQINELQFQILPLEKDISDKETLNQSYINDLGSARQSLTIAERFYAQVQLEHSRNKDKLDNLRGKIEDDFGLVAFTYAQEIEGPSPLPFEGLVEQLPNITLIPENLEESILRQRAILRRIGPINQEANQEYKESKDRLDFLNEQVLDLNQADTSLRKVISELDNLIRTEFKKTFDAVATEFHTIFSQLFIGGSAKLSLSDSEDPNEIGVDIEAKLPGRREQGLSLLSGGERSLTATALIFALLRVSPTPFCVLDEVDAMLDESNVNRFCELLKELSQKTQFIVITHNRNTVQVADVIYGVTMGRDSASQLIGLRMDELDEEMVK